MLSNGGFYAFLGNKARTIPETNIQGPYGTPQLQALFEENSYTNEDASNSLNVDKKEDASYFIGF